MSLFQALVLGIVQGATEFLPISSSAHLVLVPYIFGWETPSVAFDVAVHLGTLVSVVYVFRERLMELFSALREPHEANRRLLRHLAIGTVPAVLVGVGLGKYVEDVFEAPVKTAFLLGITGWFLLTTEHKAEQHEGHERSDEEMNDLDAATVGIAQAVAVLPGISRSGATVGAAVWRGVGRVAALRFSFLLSIPVIAGAVAVKVPDMLKESAGGSAGAFLLGIVASAVTGVFAIRAFLGLIERRGLRPFGVYCFLMMTAGLLTGLARG